MNISLEVLEELLERLVTAQTILKTSTMNHHQQQQPQSIRDNVTFPSRCLFVDIYTALFSTFRSFHALAIDDRGTRLGVASGLGAHFCNQDFIDVFPQSLTFPAPKVAIHGLPGWQIGRQHSPLAASTHHVQNGIQDLPHLPLARSS